MGLASGTLRKLRLTGDGPRYLKLGRAVRYRVSDIDVWLDDRICTSTSHNRPLSMPEFIQQAEEASRRAYLGAVNRSLSNQP